MSQSQQQLDQARVVELLRGLGLSHRQLTLHMHDIVDNLQEIHKSLKLMNEEELKQIDMLEELLATVRING